MIEDTLELDDDEIEEEAQGEVDKVLHELTDGIGQSFGLVSFTFFSLIGLLGEGGAVGSELVSEEMVACREAPHTFSRFLQPSAVEAASSKNRANEQMEARLKALNSVQFVVRLACDGPDKTCSPDSTYKK